MKFNHKLMNNNFTNQDIGAVKSFLKNKDTILTQSKKVEEFDVRAIGNTMAEMKYDIENITVKEGVKIKINLINEGIDQAMLHNILFVNFGKRKDVAAAAVTAGNDKAFVPDHPELIAASSLAKPGETVTFEFDAPKKGNYEYFCSYPGHSQIMRGYLFVK